MVRILIAKVKPKIRVLGLILYIAGFYTTLPPLGQKTCKING